MIPHYPGFRSVVYPREVFPVCFSFGFVSQQANGMQSIARSGIRLVIIGCVSVLSTMLAIVPPSTTFVAIVVRVLGYRSRCPGSSPVATRFSEKLSVRNGVHSAS
jgi:hypothetical protein